MTPDSIEQLLRRADEAASFRRGVAADLSQRVRVRAARRRRRKIAVGMAATSVGLVGVLGYTTSRLSTRTENSAQPGPVHVPGAAIAELRAEAAALRREGDDRADVARQLARLLAQDRTRDAALRDPALHALDPVLVARIELENAAETLLHKARRLEAGAFTADAADDEYRQIVELLPDSGPADSARIWLARNSPG